MLSRMPNKEILWSKVPCSQDRDLVQTVKIFDANNEIKIIGTRHGEKLYETLLTKEEYLVATRI